MLNFVAFVFSEGPHFEVTVRFVDWSIMTIDLGYATQLGFLACLLGAFLLMTLLIGDCPGGDTNCADHGRRSLNAFRFYGSTCHRVVTHSDFVNLQDTLLVGAIISSAENHPILENYHCYVYWAPFTFIFEKKNGQDRHDMICL